jgi:hypothetical protein
MVQVVEQPLAWPRWLSTAAPVAGALSVPLIVINPFVAAALAVVAVVVGLVGAR